MENLAKEAVLHQATELFTPNVSYTMLGQLKSFNYMNPPPQVKISTAVPGTFYFMPAPSSGLIPFAVCASFESRGGGAGQKESLPGIREGSGEKGGKR